MHHVLKYLKGTADLGLTYGPSNPDSQSMLQAYCDANYAGDEDRRWSTTGYAFFIGGAAVSWSSKQQPTVAISSSDAVYMAATFAVCEAMCLRSSYLLSQDCTEVSLYGIAARYIVMVVSKKRWELWCDSHAVTIQWVHMGADPLLCVYSNIITNI